MIPADRHLETEESIVIHFGASYAIHSSSGFIAMSSSTNSTAAQVILLGKIQNQLLADASLSVLGWTSTKKLKKATEYCLGTYIEIYNQRAWVSFNMELIRLASPIVKISLLGESHQSAKDLPMFREECPDDLVTAKNVKGLNTPFVSGLASWHPTRT
jgi:hypothetical protein